MSSTYPVLTASKTELTLKLLRGIINQTPLPSPLFLIENVLSNVSEAADIWYLELDALPFEKLYEYSFGGIIFDMTSLIFCAHG